MASTERPAWLEVFAHGLEAFQDAKLEVAETATKESIAPCGGKEGPAELYLKEIAIQRERGLPSGWAGVIEVASK